MKTPKFIKTMEVREEITIRRYDDDSRLEVTVAQWKQGGMRNRMFEGAVVSLENNVDLDEIVEVLRIRAQEKLQDAW